MSGKQGVAIDLLLVFRRSVNIPYMLQICESGHAPKNGSDVKPAHVKFFYFLHTFGDHRVSKQVTFCI